MKTTSLKDGLNKCHGAVAFCCAILVAALCVLLLSADPPRLSAAPLSALPPTLIAISPTEAYNYQATTVTITGTNFTATPTVTLGIMPLPNVTFVSSTTLTATVPADLPAGPYTLTVKNPDGQSASLADAFTVLLSGDGTLGSWQTTNSMTALRIHLAAVAADGYLYALGGFDGNGLLSSVERAVINADGSLGPWQTVASMTTPRVRLAAVAADGYLYALGGYDGNGFLSSVERAVIKADGSLGPWQTVASMTTPRDGLAAVATGGYLYALGGCSGPSYLSSVERAVINTDGSLGPWQTVTSMTMKRVKLATVAIGGCYLYALGGGPDYNLSSVERAVINADGSLGPWQAVASMTTPRAGLAAVAADGYLYALGGFDGNGRLSSVERAVINADGSLGPWQTVASMTTKREGLAGVAANGYLYALGGYDGNGFLSSVERAIIDITAPTVDSLTINVGALSTTSTNVTVTVSASDSDSGVAEMSFSNDGSNWSDWQLYSTFASWSLVSGDGLKTVYGRVRDRAMHVSSVVSDTIELDTTAPTEYGLTINEGALFTNKVTVTLTIGAQPGTAQMQVSNDGGFAGAEWEPYASRKAWEITQYGSYVIPRVVYVRYKDCSGNVSATYQDDIILDVTAPTGSVEVVPGVSGSSPRTAGAEAAAMRPVAINATESYSYTVYLPLVLKNLLCPPTGPANVTLHLSAEDDVSGVADMMICNHESFGCAQWETYATTKEWYVPQGTTTTVYVKFRDHAGNVSEVVTDTITW